MKKYIAVLFLSFFILPIFAKASVIDNQSVTLSPGWNIISTPKVLLSHQFSASEISTNFDIYLLDPTSISGWQTMQGAGQTEFQPLYAYFINNKTGTNQTLQLNYNFSISPAQRLFQRTIQPGWNAVGIASPNYALPQGSTNEDVNNPKNILNSIYNNIGEIIDFTNNNINLDSVSISNNWLSKTVLDVNSLNDFRELKGYGVFVTSTTNNYLGYQNLTVPDGISPVITLNGSPTININVGDSYVDTGAIAFDNINGDITSNIIVVNPVNINIVGTYHITYNISDSSNNTAQQVTRTVIVNPVPQPPVAISNASATLGSAIVQSNNTVGYNATYGFTLANNSNNDLYVSSTPSTFVTFTKTSGTVNAATVTVSPSTVNGDTGSVYAIAAGTSRTFSFPVAIYGAAATSVNVKATAVNYSAATNLSSPVAITTGLSALSVTASF